MVTDPTNRTNTSNNTKIVLQEKTAFRELTHRENTKGERKRQKKQKHQKEKS
jgi:hypothetical protein